MDEGEFRIFLDRISDCFLKEDYGMWRGCVHLPFSMVTRKGQVILETEKDLRANFELYLQTHRTLQVDQIVRRPIAIDLCDDGTVIGTYSTDILSRGKRLGAPYISSMMLIPVEDGWKINSILNARGPHDGVLSVQEEENPG
ncbi:hypothetical protein AB1M95_14050 [Sulfitobacter sp. LCG007]